jgi:nucleotide-binding universal stress UspA family protein
MKFDIKPYEEEVFGLIKKTAGILNFPTFLIGGYVRDRILGRSTSGKDMDIVCIGTHGKGGLFHTSATEKLINHLFKPIISYQLNN